MIDPIYQDVPEKKVAELREFRASHPNKTFAVDGVRWQYIACGQGAEALLILGGAMSVGESAFRMIRRYEGGYRILSPSYPPTSDAGQVVDGLAAILRNEGVARAHIYGRSLGAGVAHLFVRRYPEMVDKLVLSGFGLHTASRTSSSKWFPMLPYAFVRAYYLRTVLGAADEAAEAEERAFLRAYYRELFERRLDQASLLAQLGILTDLAERAEEYRVLEPVERPGKVLILEALDDGSFRPAERERLIACYPGAQTRFFEKGGPWIALDNPPEYDAVLEGFLKSG
jgi:pimeloyl-ACP methyl ester carboxylesterase